MTDSGQPVRPAVLTRLLGFLDYRSFSRRTQIVVTVVGFAVFAAGAVFSWNRLDLSLSGINVLPLVVVVASAPVTILMSAVEFRVTARGLRDHAGWGSAIDIALVGYAANMLPIPGGTLVRISTLTGQAESGSPRGPTHATLTVGVVWLAAALLISGSALLGLDRSRYGAGFVIAGILLMAAAVVVARRFAPTPTVPRFLLAVFALELGSVGVSAFRTYFAFLALDLQVSIGVALVVAASTAMSSAVGIVPSGLGLKEGLSALLAGLSGFAPSAGFLASVLLRLVNMLTAGGVSAVRLVMRGRPGSTTDSAPGAD